MAKENQTRADLELKILLLKNEKRIAAANHIIAKGHLESVSYQLQKARSELRSLKDEQPVLVRETRSS